jgi:acyl carrier protein
MEKEAIIKKINSILVDDFEIDETRIKPEADLIKDIEIDSLDFVDFVVSIEKNFGIKVRSEELVGLRTIDDLYNFIFKNTNK